MNPYCEFYCELCKTKLSSMIPGLLVHPTRMVGGVETVLPACENGGKTYQVPAINLVEMKNLLPHSTLEIEAKLLSRGWTKDLVGCTEAIWSKVFKFGERPCLRPNAIDA